MHQKITSFCYDSGSATSTSRGKPDKCVSTTSTITSGHRMSSLISFIKQYYTC